MSTADPGFSSDLASLYGVVADVQLLFEASDLKHRLRRLGFAPPAADCLAPFNADRFVGDLVLSPTADASSLCGEQVSRANWIFYCGVVLRPLLGGLVAPSRDDRPELQVGIVAINRQGSWIDEDENHLGAFRSQLGAAWSITRREAQGETARCLFSAVDLLTLVDQSAADHFALMKARDAFFTSRWNDLCPREPVGPTT